MWRSLTMPRGNLSAGSLSSGAGVSELSDIKVPLEPLSEGEG
jgi:hypothetical protein